MHPTGPQQTPIMPQHTEQMPAAQQTMPPYNAGPPQMQSQQQQQQHPGPPQPNSVPTGANPSANQPPVSSAQANYRGMDEFDGSVYLHLFMFLFLYNYFA